MSKNGKSNSGAAAGGVSFSGLLTVVFVVLKLTGVIDWSWWWVLGAFWIPAVLITVIAVVAGILALMVIGANRIVDLVMDRMGWWK